MQPTEANQYPDPDSRDKATNYNAASSHSSAHRSVFDKSFVIDVNK